MNRIKIKALEIDLPAIREGKVNKENKIYKKKKLSLLM